MKAAPPVMFKAREKSSTTPDWTFISVPDSLERHSVGRENQVPSADIRPNGRFPVVDQGQSFVAGYSDEESRVIRKDLPVVVFGDHTRCFKYVDFPFILGADGTKVLRPKAKLFVPRFFYFALRSLDIPNRGYNRHFTVLKKKSLPCPPLSEQQKIAVVLGVVQRAMGQQERLLVLTTELKKTLLNQLFTTGLNHEPKKQTNIGSVPESWAVVALGDVVRIERGKFSHRPRNDPRFYGGHIPFVQTGDVSGCDGHIRAYSQTLNEEGLLVSKVFPAKTILITIAANIGFSGILEFDSACPDSLIGLTPSDQLDVEFLQHYLTTQQPAMDRLAPRGTQKNINIEFLRPWPVPIPSLKEQREIVHCLNSVDSRHRVARRKHATLNALFQTLLHQLMTAKVRVLDLHLPDLDSVAAA